MWADNSHSKEILEQMLRDLVEEASRWDLENKPASLWWTSTYDPEEKEDTNLGHRDAINVLLKISSRYWCVL